MPIMCQRCPYTGGCTPTPGEVCERGDARAPRVEPLTIAVTVDPVASALQRIAAALESLAITQARR